MASALQGKRVCVVVLGDIGHSPRMQYHVCSLLQHGSVVDLVGYVEGNFSPAIAFDNAKRLTVHKLSPVPELGLPSAVRLITKAIWQFLTLMVALFSISRSDFILCQNPPAIPTLVCCYLVARCWRSKLIIDWHNYTHTILGLGATSQQSTGTRILVRIAKFIEASAAGRTFGNFCVTNAMREDLQKNWNIRATTLYDRPPEQFQPISLDKKHNLFMKLSKTNSELLPRSCDDFKASGVVEANCFTQKQSNGTVVAKPKRPALVLSSTSWTPDEDFSLLIEALNGYEEVCVNGQHDLPNLFCVITGKGPLKAHYQEEVRKRKWTRITVLMPWLEQEDYPKILAAADLGVCLHYSSSGLDLPMKVVDMFGAGLPVCAVNFKCLNELVVHKKNGFVFDTKDELLQYLTYWFERFPENEKLINIKREFQENLHEFQNVRWTENWNRHALPMFQGIA